MKEYTKEDCKSKIAKWEERLKDCKEELIVGQWYKTTYHGEKTIIAMNTKIQKDGCCVGSGFFDGEYRVDVIWHTPSGAWSTASEYTLATDKEVQQALEKEAVKRGFKEGVEIRGLRKGSRCVLPLGGFELLICGTLWFGIGYNGYDIFHNGVWAEIITEPVYEYQWFRKDINEVTPKFYVEKLSCFGMRIEETKRLRK